MGVRDLGLLESALARPRSGYYASISEQAAALLQSLAGNHAFVDGNKRGAFAATAVFLRMNGYKLVVDADEAERFLIEDVIKRPRRGRRDQRLAREVAGRCFESGNCARTRVTRALVKEFCL